MTSSAAALERERRELEEWEVVSLRLLHSVESTPVGGGVATRVSCRKLSKAQKSKRDDDEI